MTLTGHLRMWGLSGLLLASGLATAASCPQPGTDYERVYCEIVARGEGGSLPSFDDFRRNTPQVQALLLKRQASRLGIELPAPGHSEPVAAEASTREPATQERPVASETVTQPAPAPVAVGLEGCALQGPVIRCPHRRYALANNLPNRALAEGVLADSNTLGLPVFNGDASNDTALRQYLASAYDHYILKMLDIGLGGATMSFSEFYHNYQRHRASGVDYAQRMEQTFQLLKHDKRTRAVPARLTDRLPGSLEHCSGIGARVVVCDDVGTNWVFVDEGGR